MQPACPPATCAPPAGAAGTRASGLRLTRWGSCGSRCSWGARAHRGGAGLGMVAVRHRGAALAVPGTIRSGASILNRRRATGSAKAFRHDARSNHRGPWLIFKGSRTGKRPFRAQAIKRTKNFVSSAARGRSRMLAEFGGYCRRRGDSIGRAERPDVPKYPSTSTPTCGKTQQSWADTCRQLVFSLTDGSFHVANFKF